MKKNISLHRLSESHDPNQNGIQNNNQDIVRFNSPQNGMVHVKL